MPMQVVQGAAIPNHFQPNNAQHAAAKDVIVMLEYADLWRGAGTLHSNNLMRVDMQGKTAGPPAQYNIQVQVNEVRGNSTVAHVLVSETLETKDNANQRGVANRVISALNQSLDGGHSYSVTGTAP